MEMGFIGLGRMGGNMVRRMLASKKIDVIAYNRHYDKVKDVMKLGAEGARTVPELVGKLRQTRRVVWMMLPAGSPTEDTFRQLLKLLKRGDVIIDGANSNFHDTVRRHAEAKKKGIDMLDVGVSGGIIAAERGYPMMVGGKKSVYRFCRPIFDSFGIKEGYDLVGEEPGSGHYVKMIHNAIEYGMMQSIAEGFDLLGNGRFRKLDLERISHIWNHGTIISSFLMEMTENALKRKDLKKIAPFVQDSGEGRWSAIEAMEHDVPFLVNTAALHARYTSRTCSTSDAFRLLAAIRNEFGGHAVKKR